MSLDRPYLRACAIYWFLKTGRIDQEQARTMTDKPMRGHHRYTGWLNNTIDIWVNGPLKELAL